MIRGFAYRRFVSYLHVCNIKPVVGVKLVNLDEKEIFTRIMHTVAGSIHSQFGSFSSQEHIKVGLCQSWCNCCPPRFSNLNGFDQSCNKTRQFYMVLGDKGNCDRRTRLLATGSKGPEFKNLSAGFIIKFSVITENSRENAPGSLQ